MPFTLAETCNLQIEVQGHVFYILCGDGGIVANAGPDQVVSEGTLVQLDGSRRTPPLGPGVRYDWTQLAGPPVTLNATDALHPTFTAPLVPPGGQMLTFQLIVTTPGGASLVIS